MNNDLGRARPYRTGNRTLKASCSEGTESLLGDSHDTKFNVVKELKTSLDAFPKLRLEPRPLQLA